MDNLYSQVGSPTKLAERYAEYPGPAHDPHLYYPYEPSPPAQTHIVATKHHHGGGGGHKNNAAMSALTLLAFLFFLHILQQCLKDHMTDMTPSQVMIMTSGKEGDEIIAKKSHSKFDKTGEYDTDIENKRDSLEKTAQHLNDENYLKITTSDDKRWRKSPMQRNSIKKNSPILDSNNPFDD